MARGCKPGHTNNPGGRPKTAALTEALKEELIKNGNKDKLARKLIQLALKKNNIHAIKYIYDRVEGTPRQSVDMTHAGEIGVVLNIPTELMPKDKNE